MNIVTTDENGKMVLMSKECSNANKDMFNKIKQKKAIVIYGGIELEEYIKHEDEHWFCSGAI